MKSFRWLCALLLALLCLSGLACAESTVYQLGDKIDDFTITTHDGKTVTLSEVLKEKEAVLINIWASWCNPCRMEFPYMQQAYEQYADKVEIIALSSESTDTNEKLASFVAELGLTFNVGQDTASLATRFSATSIPTSVIIDRFGTICFRISGALTDVSYFTRLFDAFVGEGYTQSTVYKSIPSMKVNITPSTEEELNAALNTEGGTLNFRNGSGAYDWPLLAGEKDGRSVVISSNTGLDESISRVLTTVTGQAGDAIAVTFKVSSAAGLDLMQLSINGDVVKSFGGEDGWMTYAWQLPADGEYEVEVGYAKYSSAASGEDTLWVDSIAHLTGSDARAALDANPVYPVAEQLSAVITADTARQVIITDPTGAVSRYYDDAFYLLSQDTATFEVFLPAYIDPEEALVVLNVDQSVHCLADCLTDGRYLLSGTANSVETTGYCDSSMFLYPSANNSVALMITYFRNETNLDLLLSVLTANANGDTLGSWAYAEEPVAAAANGESAYTVKYVDQHGDPVSGVMLQVCDESTCQVFVSDENGVCSFTLAPYAWELHTMMLPDGYSGDTQTVTQAPVEGGEMNFTLTKQ